MSKYKGLSKQEVEDRISRKLVNVSSKTKSKTIGEILIENIFSVFNIIIFSIIIFLLYFYISSGDRRLLLDSIGVLFVAVTNTLIAVVQEIRAKRALDKVHLLLKNEAKVIREGETITIDQSEIVKDDIICVKRGDQVVVDGKVLESNRLEIDEGLLTGESVPIEKKKDDEVLSGSFCVSGNGYYIAEKVGDASYASGITKLAKRFKMGISPLQRKINFIVQILFVSAVTLVILNIIFQNIPFTDIRSIRRISTIMLSLVPQGLVLMASVSFALGVYRISKIGAIIQKLNAIESFSNVKVVCTDKTGTLTQNKLTVNKLTLLNNLNENEVKDILGTYAKFSSDKNATLRTLEIYRPVEQAECKDELPFSSENKMSMLKLSINGNENTYVLGGYDVLVNNTANELKVNVENTYKEKNLKIYRNLLFGKISASLSLNEVKDKGDSIEIEPLCIISISDQIRHDVMDAINLFHKNEIEVKILSGDSAEAVQAIAHEIGWEIKDAELISGKELDDVKDENLAHTIMQKKIFARLKPDHKLRIIKSLKKSKIYNAMIGDGVNDLPAIKESDMGIAMEEGSKITKEVADIVLLKNKFSLLPNIFDEGNKIVNTVSSVAKLFLTKNFLVIYLVLLFLFFAVQFPLTPRRVALINLFSIGLPSLIIALKNSNIKKCRNFTLDLITFVSVSALIITGAGILGQYLAQKYYDISIMDMQMVMMSIMIITTSANFLAVSLHKEEKNIKLYLFYGLLIVVLYIFLAVTNIDFVLFNILKKFYEITYLDSRYWGIVALISLISSGLLFVLQKIRERLVSKYTM
jgi:cation-transporting P-type ATPase E